MNKTFKMWLALPLLAAVATAADNIKWLVEYDGTGVPDSKVWQAVGAAATNANIASGGLRVFDRSADEHGYFQAAWKPEADREIIVEARVRVESMVNDRKSGTSLWPLPDGSPVVLLVNDGQHEGGLVLRPEKIATLVDRVVPMNAKADFHTYRLVIRGRNMSVFVDGARKIIGEGAFARKSTTGSAFIQFGSTSKKHQGESYWSSVKLGVRSPASPNDPPKLRLTFSEPWEIPSLPRGNSHERPYEHLHVNTRPFLHDMGRGLLLMSVGQGPDAIHEPYGVFKSTDQGKTWSPVKDMQYKSFAPQSIARLPDGDILGVSRWTTKYNREEGVYIGFSYRFDPKAERFQMNESLIRVPEGMGEWLAFSRDLLVMANGELLATVYGAAKGGRRAMILKSSDVGKSWTHHATLGPRPEPCLVRFSENEMMAVLRINGWMPFEQIWSNDGGKTWTPPLQIEEGSVDPDLVYMSNGVLACSYGRPGSNLMFSLDRGKTWVHHHVLTELRGYNYTAIREISPGRLLFVHDSPRMQALYIDVERLDGRTQRGSD